MADEHVYVDDGISGAKFANRPGFPRMMNALKPRAVSGAREVRRISARSEDIETADALQQLLQAGVRVLF